MTEDICRHGGKVVVGQPELPDGAEATKCGLLQQVEPARAKVQALKVLKEGERSIRHRLNGVSSQIELCQIW